MESEPKPNWFYQTTWGFRRIVLTIFLATVIAMMGTIWLLEASKCHALPVYPNAKLLETRDEPGDMLMPYNMEPTVHVVTYTVQASPEAIYDFYDRTLTGSEGMLRMNTPDAKGVRYKRPAPPKPWPDKFGSRPRSPEPPKGFSVVWVIATANANATVTASGQNASTITIIYVCDV